MVKLFVALLAAAVVAAGVYWGTFAAGGSDSFCYAYQSERWAVLDLQPVNRLALRAPWPDTSWTFTPSGHVPSPTVAGAIVPICPAGLSIAMAPFHAVGRDAVFLVVPLMGGLLVWSTWWFGRLFSDRVGVASAVIVACSPVFLLQLFQPMSDVPAAAWWMLASALAAGASARFGPAAAGLASSAAIITRPNLLPLAAAIGMFLMIRPGAPRTERWTRAARFAAGCLPGCLAVAAINFTFYGSPLASGYGSLDQLFSAAHIRPNVALYGRRLLETQTPLMILALAAPFAVARRDLANLVLVLSAIVTASYLPYRVFQDWWALRFLLPMLPLVSLAAMATVDAAASRFGRRAALVVTIAATLLVARAEVRVARERGVFDVARLEARFVRAGEWVDRTLPPNAIVFANWQSGSVRYHGRRMTIDWGSLDPAWFDRAVEFVRAEGYEPYVLVERWEEPSFRARFGSGVAGRLDWPPVFDMWARVRIFRVADRSRYFAGGSVDTEYAR